MRGNPRGNQLLLPFPNPWGGKRPGAGRKRQSARSSVPHRKRAPHRAAHPVHVTMRSLCRSLRSQFVFPTIRGAIADANTRHGQQFRIVHFSVQADHIHLIVEARTRQALSRGLLGFASSAARRVNRLLFRRGSFFSGRWHEHALVTPRSVRHAIVYVLANCKKHGHRQVSLDHCSSAPFFPYFQEFSGLAPVEADRSLVTPSVLARGSPVSAATTWLLQYGWRRDGPISAFDTPAAPRRSSALRDDRHERADNRTCRIRRPDKDSPQTTKFHGSQRHQGSRSQRRWARRALLPTERQSRR